ncbi:MAG: protein kinase domain-containing protein [Acidimicrobiales bacterium]
MPVDQALVDEAIAAFNAVVVGPLKDGGQKAVRLVTVGQDQRVLKVIQLGQTSPESLQRASREVDLLQSIDSPNVVRAASDLILLRDPPEGAAWLEELLDGDDLADNVGAAWDCASAVAMGREVAAGLAELHDRRVVHRDLSSHNIRRRADGTYVVMDPGYARHELLPPITIAGHPGTYGFMSPEHLSPLPAGPTAFSDVFCVGILLYLALTGDVPIRYEGDPHDYVNRLKPVQYRDLTDIRSDLPDELVGIVRRCLHRQPARRYRHARELAGALAEVVCP